MQTTLLARAQGAIPYGSEFLELVRGIVPQDIAQLTLDLEVSAALYQEYWRMLAESSDPDLVDRLILIGTLWEGAKNKERFLGIFPVTTRHQ